MTATLAW